MIHLAVRSEYSFKKAYAPIKKIVQLPQDIIGIADDNNTFGHAFFEKAMLAAGKKPIFGVRLTVVDNLTERFNYVGTNVIFIAKNNDGLKEIYKLVSKAWDQFYYFPRLSKKDYENISFNIYAINGSSCSDSGFDFFANNFCTNPTYNIKGGVYIDDNNFINRDDKGIYQLLAGSSKRGNDRNYAFENDHNPQYVLNEDDARAYFGEDAVLRTHEVASYCNVTLQHASMVKFEGIQTIMSIIVGNKKSTELLKNIEYQDRVNYELNLIKQKGYDDYFLIVSDMIRFAKNNGVLVGPSRGSSAGSLVCYLLDITEIDPIKHNLLFERFIDINRDDLPDIDIDFPDDKRDSIIKYLVKKYGAKNVASLANINRFQSKSAISEFAMCLGIPKYETDAVKDAIVQRSGGDARASNKIEDTLKETDAGKKFIEKFPVMKLVQNVEGHANHAGKHAAGIIVSNEELINFAATNSRDGIVMLDKKSAEYLNLLKIDVLGLRTLTILAEICESILVPYSFLYNLPLNNKEAYQIFQDMRLDSVFQFDGPSLRNIVKQIGATEFNDLAIITALSRPGALNSGGTGRYIEYKKGNKETVYYSEIHKRITEETLGVVIYQEQMMKITKDIGELSWSDVNSLRQASSRSMGDEYFAKFKDNFMKGAVKNLDKEEYAELIWNDIKSAGSWLFNKSHAVSYAVVSYWTAYFKANFPLEFAVANLNHQPDDDAAIKLLRDLDEKEGIKYIPIDPDTSTEKWTVQNGILVGGLTNLEGIGIVKAKKIISNRNAGIKPTPAIYKKLMNPVTVFDDLYPCRTKFKDFYNDPASFGLTSRVNFIREVTGKGKYLIIGKIIERDVRDRNDLQAVTRRGSRIDGNSLYLRLIVADDTDSVICLISHKNWERLNGAEYSESLVIDQTWVMIEGDIKSDWRTIDIHRIGILED